MPTIKDALDIIGKLTVAEQESLKTMLLSPAFVKSLNIEDFVAKERFANTVWEDLKNRIIDLHCFEYTDEGEILYDGDCFPVETFSGKGRIEEIEVSCIEPYSQVMFHLGYEFDENDAHDVKLLCETLHIEIPNEYR